MVDVIIGDDFTLRINGARDPDGSFLNSATVTFELFTAAGVSVTTGSLSYVAASNGNYRGVIESTVTSALTAGAQYYVIFVLVQSSYDWIDRLDLVAKPPGGGILTPEIWSEFSGITLDSTNSATISRMVNAVSSALTRKCYPNLLGPKALTLAPFDAPCNSRSLFLPRPVRNVTAIYYRSGAGGDPSAVDLTADLLVAGTDYYSKPTDVITGWNRTGEIIRLNRSCWGWQAVRPPERLAHRLENEPGSVFVTGHVGPTTADPAVQAAACAAVSMLMERRTKGMPLQSESWAGYSYSGSSQFTAEAAVNSPEVVGLLQSAGVLPIHVG